MKKLFTLCTLLSVIGFSQAFAGPIDKNQALIRATEAANAIGKLNEDESMMISFSQKQAQGFYILAAETESGSREYEIWLNSKNGQVVKIDLIRHQVRRRRNR